MQIEKEISRAVKHQSACDTQISKSKEEIDAIVVGIKLTTTNQTFDFSKLNSLVLNQNGHKRFVKLYSDSYSTEKILCQCIKQILDRVFKVKYPNRNKTIRSLFDILSAVIQMSDFTIIKFDFKDYFNSVSSTYVFEKFIRSELTDRFEIDLIENFVNKTKYAYAGLSTSNIIAEIAALEFDEVLRQLLVDKGVLYLDRYIDDGIIIFNENIEESKIKYILQKALDKVYYDIIIDSSNKCKTKFNKDKFCYISRRFINSSPISFDFLGYEIFFSLNNSKIDVKYGITLKKRIKYNKRIDKLIACYINPSHTDYDNLEILRHRIVTFTSRVVYLKKNSKSNVSKVKGFISNYGELRYLIEASLVENDTLVFLKGMVKEAFGRSTMPMPYFIKDCQSLNLFENMKRNKTILLVDHIGYDHCSLIKLCKQIGVSVTHNNGKNRWYDNLVRDYLIKMKVGY